MIPSAPFDHTKPLPAQEALSCLAEDQTDVLNVTTSVERLLDRLSADYEAEARVQWQRAFRVQRARRLELEASLYRAQVELLRARVLGMEFVAAKDSTVSASNQVRVDRLLTAVKTELYNANVTRELRPGNWNAPIARPASATQDNNRASSSRGPN